MPRTPVVYILANRRNGTLYVGCTTNLAARLNQHRAGVVDAFTKQYRVHRLVYFEAHSMLADARQRERSIKRWRRAWKIALIEAGNRWWRDLGRELQ
jgi:putative endonuclease